MERATEKIGMPLEEFLELSHDQPFELINGERIPKMPNVFGHSETIRLVFRWLDNYTQTHNLGEAYSETTFILPATDDVDWVRGIAHPGCDVLLRRSDTAVQSGKPGPPRSSAGFGP